MSILSIQTNFFGVDRPPKASFLTGRCDLLAPTREDLGFRENLRVANREDRGYTIFIDDPIIQGLENGDVVRVTGVSDVGANTIVGYDDPSVYLIGEFVQQELQGFILQDVITGLTVAIVRNDGFLNGLTFTFFRYTFRPTPSNLGTIGSGSTIVDFMLNRRDGLAFANGTRIWVYVDGTTGFVGSLCTLAVGVAPGAANQISIEPGELYGRVLDIDSIVTLVRSDIWNTDMPDPLAVTSCIELWSGTPLGFTQEIPVFQG
jgi:hypothetical protein